MLWLAAAGGHRRDEAGRGFRGDGQPQTGTADGGDAGAPRGHLSGPGRLVRRLHGPRGARPQMVARPQPRVRLPPPPPALPHLPPDSSGEVYVFGLGGEDMKDYFVSCFLVVTGIGLKVIINIQKSWLIKER